MSNSVESFPSTSSQSPSSSSLPTMSLISSPPLVVPLTTADERPPPALSRHRCVSRRSIVSSTEGRSHATGNDEQGKDKDAYTRAENEIAAMKQQHQLQGVAGDVEIADRDRTAMSATRGKKRPAEDMTGTVTSAAISAPPVGSVGGRFDVAGAAIDYRRRFFSSNCGGGSNTALSTGLRVDDRESRFQRALRAKDESIKFLRNALQKATNSLPVERPNPVTAVNGSTKAKILELLRVLRQESSSTSAQASDILEGKDKMSDGSIASLLDACLTEACHRDNPEHSKRSLAENAALQSELAREREKRSSMESGARCVEAGLRKRILDVASSLAKARRTLRVEKNQRIEAEARVMEEVRKREQAEDDASALHAKLEDAACEVATLTAARRAAEDRALMLNNQLTVALQRESTLQRTKDELEQAKKQISQLEIELTSERETRNQDQFIVIDSDTEVVEAETQEAFGLTQQVSELSRKVDSEHGQDSKRVRDQISHARRLLEKILNGYLKTHLQISDGAKSLSNEKKINMLRDRAGFPLDFVDAMHEVRRYGNDAIHDKELPSRGELDLVMRKFNVLVKHFQANPELRKAGFSG